VLRGEPERWLCEKDSALENLLLVFKMEEQGCQKQEKARKQLLPLASRQEHSPTHTLILVR